MRTPANRQCFGVPDEDQLGQRIQRVALLAPFASVISSEVRIRDCRRGGDWVAGFAFAEAMKSKGEKENNINFGILEEDREIDQADMG